MTIIVLGIVLGFILGMGLLIIAKSYHRQDKVGSAKLTLGNLLAWCAKCECLFRPRPQPMPTTRQSNEQGLVQRLILSPVGMKALSYTILH